MQGSRVLGEEWPHGSRLALRVAQFGLDRYAADVRSWPCGTNGGQTPGLMLGLAGIGLFYLRLYDPTIPSILLLTPQRSTRTPG